MRGIVNKTGSHVGMIISFVIFITFIVFLYSIVKPAITTGEDKKTILSALETQILENISTNFTSASVQINRLSSPTTSNCVELVNFLSFSEFYTPNIIIQNEANVIENSYSDYGSALSDVMINRKSKSSLFFKVYYSKEFSQLGSTTTSCIPVTDYNIGSVTTDNYVFGKEVTKLMGYYNTTYENLKSYLQLPPGNEFGFGFIKSDGTEVDVGESPKSASVYAEDIPVQYVDSNANILSGFINIKVW
jgi:hypothetical protein